MSNTDFDPDAYLAAGPKAAAFDPDKYLGAQPQSFGDKLMQTWPVKAAQTLYSAATLPGDVASGAGNVAPKTPGTWSDEDEARLQLNNAGLADRASALAGVASPAAVASRVGVGAMGVPLRHSVAPEIATPSISELKAAATAGYESPVVGAVKISAGAAPRLADEIQGNLFNELGVDENLAPKTYGILNKLKAMPQPEEGEPDPFLTVANLRSLRRTLGNAAGSIDPTERLAAKSSMQHLDEYLANMPEGDVIAGDPKAAAAILKDANANYSAMKTASDFDVRMTRAQLRAAAANSGMNVGNTIRQRMADIIVTPKLARSFTPDELAQMKSIVEGTPVTNATRYAGNVLGGGGGMLAALYGLGHAGIAPIAGYMLRKMGNFQTTRAAGALNEAVRMRSPLGQERAADALAQQTRPSLAPLARGTLPAATMPGSPLLQLPTAVEAQSQENGVPGPPSQQHNGGRIEQQRATGGQVGGDESEHKGQVESKSDDKSSREKAKTLYVMRPLLNAGDLIAWAKRIGFKKTVVPADMHVTIAFSRDEVDHHALKPERGALVASGGKRVVKPLGEEGAVVLAFDSPELSARWKEFQGIGASWDWDSYQPHVTITYDGDGMDLKGIKPYMGPLRFGPEKFSELDDEAKEKIKERASGGAIDGTTSINRSYDVPYLAGSSNDDKTVYIDRRVPKRIAVKRANGKGYESIDPAEFLAEHEREEHKAMRAGKSYEQAHVENGTAAERAKVKAHGLNWDHYEEVMDGLLSHIEHEHPKRPPPDLYKKPYPHKEAVLLKRLGDRAESKNIPRENESNKPAQEHHA